MAKTATKWTPLGGVGYTVPQLGIYLQDNKGNLLVTNLVQNFIPNPYYVMGKIATAWSAV